MTVGGLRVVPGAVWAPAGLVSHSRSSLPSILRLTLHSDKTHTDTVTRTFSQGGRVITTVGPQTVAQAVSGSSTLMTTFTGAFAAQETDSTNAAAGIDRSVKVAGACLGAAVAVVGLL